MEIARIVWGNQGPQLRTRTLHPPHKFKSYEKYRLVIKFLLFFGLPQSPATENPRLKFSKIPSEPTKATGTMTPSSPLVANNTRDDNVNSDTIGLQDSSGIGHRPFR
jgi:hypothetical protein